MPLEVDPKALPRDARLEATLKGDPFMTTALTIESGNAARAMALVHELRKNDGILTQMEIQQRLNLLATLQDHCAKLLLQNSGPNGLPRPMMDLARKFLADSGRTLKALAELEASGVREDAPVQPFRRPQLRAVPPLDRSVRGVQHG